MKRRRFDAETKVAIVFEGLRDETTIADLCRKYQISEAMYYRWRDKFLEGGKRAFSNGVSGEDAYKAEIEKLQKIIGKQAIQIEILKKTLSTGQVERSCSRQGRGG